jgi:hypothetical protein
MAFAKEILFASCCIFAVSGLQAAASVVLTDRQIASLLNCSNPTLKKCYRKSEEYSHCKNVTGFCTKCGSNSSRGQSVRGGERWGVGTNHQAPCSPLCDDWNFSCGDPELMVGQKNIYRENGWFYYDPVALQMPGIPAVVARVQLSR